MRSVIVGRFGWRGVGSIAGICTGSHGKPAIDEADRKLKTGRLRGHIRKTISRA